MKFDIATDMLFELLNHRKLTAQYFAQNTKFPSARCSAM